MFVECRKVDTHIRLNGGRLKGLSDFVSEVFFVALVAKLSKCLPIFVPIGHTDGSCEVTIGA